MNSDDLIWIPVASELPPNKNPWIEYLTTNTTNNRCEVLYWDAEYQRFCTAPHQPPVTHWRSLPDPPNEKNTY